MASVTYVISLLAAVLVLVVQGTPSGCCLPEVYQGIVYRSDIVPGRRESKFIKFKIDVFVDYKNQVELHKYESKAGPTLNYEVLTDFAHGYEYLSSEGKCFSRSAVRVVQSDRCKLCPIAFMEAGQYYGSDELKLPVTYFYANCSVPLTEEDVPEAAIGGNFAQAGDDDVLPVYLQSSFKSRGKLVQRVMDFVNFKLEITDRSVFTPPTNCRNYSTLSKRRMNKILRKIKNNNKKTSSSEE